MACNVKRNPISRYCKGDFRTSITLEKIATASGFNNNIRSANDKKFENVSAIVKSINASDTSYGEALNISYTHLFIIEYYTEYEDFLQNTAQYNITYNNYIFDIQSAQNENLDNRYIIIKARMRRNDV